MSVDALEFAAVVTGAVIIVEVVYELARLILERQDDDDGYDGRTRR